MKDLFVSQYNELAFRFVSGFKFLQAPMVTIICGQEGLGKTALLTYLQAKMHPVVKPTIFMGTQKFISNYSFSSQNGELSIFRKRIRATKLFLLDDIHLLKGKKKTIEELFHTLDTIWMQGGKAVLTYQGDNINFEFLGQRFASRLNSGFNIYLAKPTESEINEFLMYYLTSVGETSLFDPRLIAKAANMKQVIEFVSKTKSYPFGDFEEKVNLVLPFVCQHYETDAKKILEGSKTIRAVNARYMMFLLLHEVFKFSFKEMALYFKKDLYSLKTKSLEIKEKNQELFESLCQKLYTQLNSFYQDGYHQP